MWDWLRSLFPSVGLQGKPLCERSGRWPTIRAAHLKVEPDCQVCGARINLNVHHKRPVHLHPELELDMDNLITLCEGADGLGCHFRFGHLWNWSSYNPQIDLDARQWRRKIENRPERDQGK
jgi:5-methylcytosine-specific restriction protein A